MQLVATFLTTAAGEPRHPTWSLIALRGRHGTEAVGPRWCDVDLDAGTITIEQQRVGFGR